MKKILLIGLLLCIIQAKSQVTPIQKEINEIDKNAFVKETLFAEKQVAPDVLNEYTHYFKKFSFLKIDKITLNKLANDPDSHIEMTIPIPAGNITLQLIRNKTAEGSSKILASDGTVLDYNRGSHYYGVIKGQANSLVTINFFADNVMGVMSCRDGNYVLGKAKMKDGKLDYFIYNDKDMKNPVGFSCASTLVKNNMQAPPVINSVTGTPQKCVSVYIVMDYPLYLKFNDLTLARQYIDAMFAGMWTIYRNESISISMYQSVSPAAPKIYNSTDPYGSPTTLQSPFGGPPGLMEIFYTNIGITFGADLAHLFSGRALTDGQGVGNFFALCDSTNRTAVSSRLGIFAPGVIPLSSEIGLISHEMGHDLNSVHTHTCSWYGGIPIDGCGGYIPPGGSVPVGPDYCATNNPGLPPLGGTIMSYCDVVPGVGIILANGFGIQPGNVIRDAVLNASCLSTCTTTCNADVIIDGTAYPGGYYVVPLTESSTWIKTSGAVKVHGGSVKFDATNTSYVELDPGFESTSQGTSLFIAKASDGCTVGAPSFTSSQHGNYSDADLKNIPSNKMKSSFRIYPNPATDYFTIVSDNDLKNATIEMFDMSGKMQQIRIRDMDEKSKKIMVGNLSKGVYMIKIITSVKTDFAKIVLQ